MPFGENIEGVRLLTNKATNLIIDPHPGMFVRQAPGQDRKMATLPILSQTGSTHHIAKQMLEPATAWSKQLSMQKVPCTWVENMHGIG